MQIEEDHDESNQNSTKMAIDHHFDIITMKHDFFLFC